MYQHRFSNRLLGALLVLSATAGSSVSAQTISTIDAWDGTSFNFFQFGHASNDSHGQTFLALGPRLTSFSFWLGNSRSGNGQITDPAQLQFRAYVMAYEADENIAQGIPIGDVLWQSDLRFGSTNTVGFDRYDFNVPSLSLVAGNRYIAFLSVSGLGDRPLATNSLGMVLTNPYADGSVSVQNNPDPDNWVQFPWQEIGNRAWDYAFEATFAQVPEPGTASLLIAACVGLAATRVRRRR